MKNDNTKKQHDQKKKREFLAVSNDYFARIEHYKSSERATIWIKLHLDLLNDFAFCNLPDATKFHFVGLLMLAIKLNNRIPNDEKFLMQKLSAKSKINVELLIEKDFLRPFKKQRKSLKTNDEFASKMLVQNKRKELEKDKNRERGDFLTKNRSISSIHSEKTIDEYYEASESNGMEIEKPVGFRHSLENGKFDKEISRWLEYGDDFFHFDISFLESRQLDDEIPF